jgi:hypothetical protein
MVWYWRRKFWNAVACSALFELIPLEETADRSSTKSMLKSRKGMDNMRVTPNKRTAPALTRYCRTIVATSASGHRQVTS